MYAVLGEIKSSNDGFKVLKTLNMRCFLQKKEGKYIVKLRESPCETNESVVVENIPDCPQDTPESEHTDLDTQEPEPVTVQSTPRSRVTASSRTVMRSNGVDSTINLEKLEQLRNLGEEIRNDRFKREQKQYIKHVVNKDIYKSRIRSKYVPELFPENEPVDEPPTKSEPDVPQADSTVDQEPPPAIFKSRIRRN
ncbi:hypothetical protein M9Y10_035018 [Tritrichomonas musculus]|uniref:Uncharacterized protein n=1 Tax=Tritrichomonas musculus TaxID=1915356 RepID=A0ABR2KGI7_9EUKA